MILKNIRLTAFFPGHPGRPAAETNKAFLDFNEARDDGVTVTSHQLNHM